jgi:hypothetical protein
MTVFCNFMMSSGSLVPGEVAGADVGQVSEVRAHRAVQARTGTRRAAFISRAIGREDDVGALTLQSVADGSCGLVGIDDEGHGEGVAGREAGADEAWADRGHAYPGPGDVDAQGLQQVDLCRLGRAAGLGAGQPAVSGYGGDADDDVVMSLQHAG